MNRQAGKLLRRARQADAGAANELLTMHYEDVYSYLRRLCNCRADAEDLTQQTFLKAWSSLGRFNGRSSFSTWLHRIAHNAYIDWKRRSTQNVRFDTEPWWLENRDASSGPFAEIAERQQMQRLYRIVDQLDENYRHVVHLHYYQGLSLRETAAVLGIATSTVKYRLREVLRILRKRMSAGDSEHKREQVIPIPKGELT